ncbi:hypothetical protein AM571_PC02025 (plasmid) [Rhizobium etli 8C-3]|uniref:Uncharacterized protein n=1 Tax=Rhizobium etli 8C-3 TaxID=538025 RepID=A0A1L5PHT1_RHIET|nr:hypothetical protein AM571_PC02025 [Rhizobium etli 8C-3]
MGRLKLRPRLSRAVSRSISKYSSKSSPTADENHRPVNPEGCSLALGLEYQELFPRKRQQPLDQPADAVADGLLPSAPQ